MRCCKIALVGILLCSLMNTPAFAAPKVKTTKEIKSISEPIMDNILEGFKFDDYQKYSRDFDPSLKLSGARTKFFKVNRYLQTNLGSYLSREYMGSLRRGDMIIVLWKDTFDKTKDDVLIKLVMSGKNNHYLVTGLWLQ